MTRTAFIAAFPGELKPLVKTVVERGKKAGVWPHSSRNGVHFWAVRNEEEEWIAACAGAGQAAAARAFAAIEDGGPVDLVFSLGWAGALTHALKPGHAYSAAGVIDSRTGERFNCDAGAGEHWLVTTPTVASHAEKLRLASTYPAALVDMEAAAIARLAAMREIPFYCIKGVSDSLDVKLPDFNRFLSPTGQMETARLVLYAMFRPWHWPALIQMGENSRKASQSIARSVLDLLDAQD
jgi:adenosylhomocysteine nucleosidase